MFSRAVSVLLFVVLGCLLILGDEKQSVSLIVASAGTIGLFVYDWYVGKRVYKIQESIHIAWLGLFVSLSASTLATLSLGFSIWEIIRYIIAFLLFIYFSNRSAPQLYARILGEMATASLALLAVSYAFEISPFLQSMIPKMNLLYKSYGHSHVVDLLVFTLPFIAWRAIKEKSILSIVAFAFISIGFITSYARGVLLLLALAAAISVYRKLKTHHFNRSKLLTMVMFMMGTVFMGVFFVISPGLPWVPTTIISPPSQKTPIYESRINYWKQAALSVRDRPVFGQGPGTFSLVSKKYQDEQSRYSWFAHSYPIQTAVELGVIGLICTTILFYLTLWKKMRIFMARAAIDWKKQSLILGTVITLLYGFIEMNLDFTVVWLVFWIFLGLVNQPQEQLAVGGKKYREISVIIPLLILGIFYASAVAAAAAQIRTNGIKTAIILAPHDAGIAKKYLEHISDKKNTPSIIMDTIFLFHKHDPEVLAKLAKAQEDTHMYSYYMDKAMQSDPRNRLLIESYVSEISKKNIPTGIHTVARRLVANISTNKEADIRYLDAHWNSMQECFNKSTLLWADPPYTDTYEAKSLYFASLCLVKSQKIHEATELLKIAVSSLPAWSNIYIDYAAVVWWNGKDKYAAEKIIDLCKENKDARAHCSQFDTNAFQRTSVYDTGVNLIN